jgi:hypothetical protein
MRLTTCFLLFACKADVGIPDDWATSVIPFASTTVSDTTCGAVALPGLFGVGVNIGPDRFPGEPVFKLEFTGGPRRTCQTGAVSAPFTFDCNEDGPQQHWVNQDERDCIGNADVWYSGAFLGPREAYVDIVFDVTDCPCETSCIPYPAPCKIEARFNYADP